MPLDFRYHLASLAAVFGALIIGILLGVAMREGPALTDQIKVLEAAYGKSEALRKIDARTDDFNGKTQGLLIRNRLAGRTVALIANPLPRAGDELSTVRNTLEDAGATVNTTISLTPALEKLSPERLLALYQGMGSVDIPSHPDTAELMGRMAHALGVAGTPLFTALLDAKLIKVSGDPTLPVSAIVYIGGAAAKQSYLSDLDLPFLHGCGELGVPFAAVEPFDIDISVMADYQKVAPLTIDNIDRNAGRITLVLALSKNLNGHFGYKDSTDSTVPDVEE